MCVYIYIYIYIHTYKHTYIHTNTHILLIVPHNGDVSPDKKTISVSVTM